MNPDILAKAIGIHAARALEWSVPIQFAFDMYRINTPARQAAFLAQTAEESGGFSVLEENMNYSSVGLLATFPKHFTAAEVGAYARQPQKIANRVYANRMGNGNEASGDGWHYRGRGILQMTGKNDYLAAGVALDRDFLANPDLVLEPNAAALTAGWEWNRGHLNDLADQGDFISITKIINGGLNGLASRQALYATAKAALGVA